MNTFDVKYSNKRSESESVTGQSHGSSGGSRQTVTKWHVHDDGRRVCHHGHLRADRASSYRALCKHENPITKELFGDNLEEANAPFITAITFNHMSIALY
jgi:hypothetical protein